MATGKTVEKYLAVTLNGQDITASINSIGDIGIDYEVQDVTTLANAIHEYLMGPGDWSIPIGGPFNNTAVTGAHVVVRPLAGDQTGAPLLVDIGIRAAPTTNDQRFSATYAIVTSYKITSGGMAWSATLRPAVGCTTTWTTKP